jgi:hypothetical protein
MLRTWGSPAQLEPSALVTFHLCYAAVLANLGTMRIVYLARPTNNCFTAVITCHSVFTPSLGTLLIASPLFQKAGKIALALRLFTAWSDI